MVSQNLVIKNASGIHARPAGELAKIAKFCESDTLILYKEKVINVKSVINIMAAGLRQGTEITVQCTGETEVEDLKTIVDAIESGLGEEI